MDYVLIKYLHLIGIIALGAGLFTQHLLLKRELDAAELKRISVVDLVYGISAGLVLLTGLLLWFAVGKPASFYTPNPIFHVKLTLFVVIAALSVYPTAFILRNRRDGQERVAVPRSLVMVVRLELLLYFVIPLLAVMMAQGKGLG